MNVKQFRISFFGEFLAYQGEDLLKFHSNKVRALLVYLIIEANHTHTREKLAALLWEGYSDKTALTNLRNTLSHLRHTLADLLENPGIRLEVTRTSVQLTLAEHPQLAIDVHEFDMLLQLCAEHTHASLPHCYLCLTRLTRAVTLYKGDFLSGLDMGLPTEFDDWLLRHRQKRFQLMMGSLGTLAEHHAALNQHVQTQHYAERMLVLEPWNEEAHRQMIVLLAKRGDIHAARAQYEACRQILLTEFKSEPSAETRLVLQNIRNGTFNTVAEARLYRIPTTLTPFVGYEAELAQILEYLWNPDCRLVTVLGAGGAGKTRLSVEVARQAVHFADLSDGIYFVPLAALKEPEALSQAIYTAVSGRTLKRKISLSQLVEILQEKRVLLILDQMEHLLQYGGYTGLQRDGSAFVQALLEAGLGIKCLVTSSIPLYIRAEWRYPLSGLTYPAPGIHFEPDKHLRHYSAIDMFWRFACRINMALKPSTEDWTAITEIASLVEGLPLALEMAAAGVEKYTFPQIATGIKQTLNFLTTPMRDVPAHHRSIRAACEIAWQMLSPLEQHVLTQLSVFPSTFTIDDIIGKVGQISRDDLSSTIIRLADKSWLYRYPPNVFRWHTIFQRFAMDQHHL